MAKLNEHAIFKVGSGILHPKISNQFNVLFHGALAENSSISPEEAEALLRGLTMQTVSVDLPDQIFKPLQKSVAPVNGFELLNHEGDLVITIEDDVTHVAVRALDMLRSLKSLRILVNKLDGNDHVLESYLFSGIMFKKLGHGALNYATGRAIYRTLTLDVQYMQRAVLKEPLLITTHTHNIFGA